MEIDSKTLNQPNDSWDVLGYLAPRALRAALYSLTGGSEVLSIHVDLAYKSNGPTTWAGALLLPHALVVATAVGKSSGDRPWNYRQETSFPLAGNETPRVTAEHIGFDQIKSVGITALQAWDTDPGCLDTVTEWEVTTTTDPIVFPLVKRDEAARVPGCDEFVQALLVQMRESAQ
ncbi:hypothetical protein QM588_05175 [Rhodococcus sp. IEGM 1354]|uniref:hypothetical protein n=1 Tax=Rhodococcus sp. IEGM 1354 TaxID=3047088 RepID=UPI0024B6B93B|nr:hypothetical protein [Rhodococcus sp. IEGM 1354]MDI9929789.1 hypothetical protein [Rhodococcus sp. IEGM 1354]